MQSKLSRQQILDCGVKDGVWDGPHNAYAIHLIRCSPGDYKAGSSTDTHCSGIRGVFLDRRTEPLLRHAGAECGRIKTDLVAILKNGISAEIRGRILHDGVMHLPEFVLLSSAAHGLGRWRRIGVELQGQIARDEPDFARIDVVLL